jgi:hypothetical protein
MATETTQNAVVDFLLRNYTLESNMLAVAGKYFNETITVEDFLGYNEETDQLSWVNPADVPGFEGLADGPDLLKEVRNEKTCFYVLSRPNGKSHI